MGRNVPVKISLIPGVGLRVDPPTFHVNEPRGDQVVWTCDSSDFTVDFGATSPSASRKLASKAAGGVNSAASGVPTVKPSSRPYKYTVTAARSGWYRRHVKASVRRAEGKLYRLRGTPRAKQALDHVLN
jgi:hypothetical protein